MRHARDLRRLLFALERALLRERREDRRLLLCDEADKVRCELRWLALPLPYDASFGGER